ncbi:hypothetical protein CHS0354_033950 [Potamilus streckersoni]|uniref:Uncharacterized protein n=1 Tax=Potamilus streckersoni TaxID=2493646 RepID=A0AAE0T9N6_9BIVA|nr:hypothetical protein CHS0354_033950 [Potamilus streckersoni]
MPPQLGLCRNGKGLYSELHLPSIVYAANLINEFNALQFTPGKFASCSMESSEQGRRRHICLGLPFYNISSMSVWITASYKAHDDR